MICVQLMGGLGNQLFQYAFMRHIEELKFPDVCLDLHWFDKEEARAEQFQRVLEIDRFQTRYHAINCHGKSPCSRVIYETQGTYSDMQLVGGDVFLCGWWQDLNYYVYVLEDLKRECTLKPAYVDDDMRLTESRMQKENSVALHVRRSDYLTETNRKTFAPCPLSYYENAVRYLAAELETAPVLYVFSDDPAWVKENMREFCGYETHFVETGEGCKDMYLMSRAHHNIIANSTFSWWAAFVNPSPGHLTIAPEKWFLDRPNPNLYFREWVVLS